MIKHSGKRFAVVAALVLALAVPNAAFAAEAADARSIAIFRVEGDVKMTKGTPKEFTAKEGYQLNDGYTVATGVQSAAYIQMDEDSILKMDQSSRVAVSKKSKDKLSLTVQSGGALMDAGAQAEGQVLETRVGNTGLTIRGTKYVISPQHEGGGTVKITMLEGEGLVDGHPLPAGSVMQVSDSVSPAGHNYEVLTSIEDSDPDLFTMQSIQESAEELVAAGIVSPGFVEALPQRIEAAAAVYERQREINTANEPAEAQPSYENPQPTLRPAPDPNATPVPFVPEPPFSEMMTLPGYGQNPSLPAVPDPVAPTPQPPVIPVPDPVVPVPDPVVPDPVVPDPDTDPVTDPDTDPDTDPNTDPVTSEPSAIEAYDYTVYDEDVNGVSYISFDLTVTDAMAQYCTVLVTWDIPWTADEIIRQIKDALPQWQANNVGWRSSGKHFNLGVGLRDDEYGKEKRFLFITYSRDYEYVAHSVITVTLPEKEGPQEQEGGESGYENRISASLVQDENSSYVIKLEVPPDYTAFASADSQVNIGVGIINFVPGSYEHAFTYKLFFENIYDASQLSAYDGRTIPLESYIGNGDVPVGLAYCVFVEEVSKTTGELVSVYFHSEQCFDVYNNGDVYTMGEPYSQHYEFEK